MSAIITTVLAGATAVLCSKLWLNISTFVDPNELK